MQGSRLVKPSAKEGKWPFGLAGHACDMIHPLGLFGVWARIGPGGEAILGAKMDEHKGLRPKQERTIGNETNKTKTNKHETNYGTMNNFNTNKYLCKT